MKSYDLRPGEVALLRRALQLYAKDQLAGFAYEVSRGRDGDSHKLREHKDAIQAADTLSGRLLKDPAPDRHALLRSIYDYLQYELQVVRGSSLAGRAVWGKLQEYVHEANRKEKAI